MLRNTIRTTAAHFATLDTHPSRPTTCCQFCAGTWLDRRIRRQSRRFKKTRKPADPPCIGGPSMSCLTWCVTDYPVSSLRCSRRLAKAQTLSARLLPGMFADAPYSCWECVATAAVHASPSEDSVTIPRCQTFRTTSPELYLQTNHRTSGLSMASDSLRSGQTTFYQSHDKFSCTHSA
jgi:hypothetical protein